jgi:hypothetical protein
MAIVKKKNAPPSIPTSSVITPNTPVAVAKVKKTLAPDTPLFLSNTCTSYDFKKDKNVSQRKNSSTLIMFTAKSADLV